MTVNELIRELLNFDMESDVFVAIMDEKNNISTSDENFVLSPNGPFVQISALVCSECMELKWKPRKE